MRLLHFTRTFATITLRSTRSSYLHFRNRMSHPTWSCAPLALIPLIALVQLLGTERATRKSTPHSTASRTDLQKWWMISRLWALRSSWRIPRPRRNRTYRARVRIRRTRRCLGKAFSLRRLRELDRRLFFGINGARRVRIPIMFCGGELLESRRFHSFPYSIFPGIHTIHNPSFTCISYHKPLFGTLKLLDTLDL